MMGNGQVAGISQIADATVSEISKGLLRCLGVKLVMAFLEVVQGLLARFVCVTVRVFTVGYRYIIQGDAEGALEGCYEPTAQMPLYPCTHSPSVTHFEINSNHLHSVGISTQSTVPILPSPPPPTCFTKFTLMSPKLQHYISNEQSGTSKRLPTVLYCRARMRSATAQATAPCRGAAAPTGTTHLCDIAPQRIWPSVGSGDLYGLCRVRVEPPSTPRSRSHHLPSPSHSACSRPPLHFRHCEGRDMGVRGKSTTWSNPRQNLRQCVASGRDPQGKIENDVPCK